MDLTHLHPVAYRRMSEDTQDNSPARQQQVIAEWCHTHTVPLIRVDPPYLDEGITGTTNDREDLNRMIRDAAKIQGANAVALDQLSRISRTDALEAVGDVYLPLRRSGVRYIIDCSKNTIHDLYDTNCILFVTIEQGHGSHAESKNIAHRVATGMKTLREQGYFFGPQPPHGYRIIDRRKNKFGREGCGKLEPVPEKAEDIRRVFDLYEKYHTAKRVSTETGWPTWRVLEALNQPIYSGRLTASPTYSRATFENIAGVKKPNDKKTQYRKKSERVYKENVYPKIISPQQYDRCQSIMEANQVYSKKREYRGHKYKGKLY